MVHVMQIKEILSLLTSAVVAASENVHQKLNDEVDSLSWFEIALYSAALVSGAAVCTLFCYCYGCSIGNTMYDAINFRSGLIHTALGGNQNRVLQSDTGNNHNVPLIQTIINRDENAAVP